MADYYVDNSGADGDGSIGTPWNNIAGHLTDLSAGDTMHIRGGADSGSRQDYQETIDSTGDADGTIANPITIQNFTGEFIRILSVDGATRCINLVKPYWIISGEDTDYHFQVDKNGENKDATKIVADNCTFKYLEILNGDSDTLLDLDGDNNTIQYCSIHDNDNGVGNDAHGVYIRDGSDDNIIEYCDIYDCYGDCIQMQNHVANPSNDNIIRYNDMYITAPVAGCGENAMDMKGGIGTKIYGNTIHGFRDNDGTCGGSGGSEAQSIVLQQDTENVEIYENTFYDVSGAIIESRVPGTLFRNNLAYDLVTEVSISNQNVLYTNTSGAELTAYNNTIVGGVGTNLIRVGDNTTVSLINNIFEDTENIQEGSGITFTYSYNGWFNAAQSKVGTGDVTGATAGFTNKGADDYTLGAGSPCIDAGTDLGYPFQGSAPDLGYIEKADAITPRIVHVTVIVTITT